MNVLAQGYILRRFLPTRWIILPSVPHLPNSRKNKLLSESITRFVAGKFSSKSTTDTRRLLIFARVAPFLHGHSQKGSFFLYKPNHTNQVRHADFEMFLSLLWSVFRQMTILSKFYSILTSNGKNVWFLLVGKSTIITYKSAINYSVCIQNIIFLLNSLPTFPMYVCVSLCPAFYKKKQPSAGAERYTLNESHSLTPTICRLCFIKQNVARWACYVYILL